MKLVINDLYAPASVLTADESELLVNVGGDVGIEDQLNDSLADAIHDFRRNGSDISFNSGTDLMGVMSDSAMQDAGEVVSNFRSLYGEGEVIFNSPFFIRHNCIFYRLTFLRLYVL